MISRKYVSTPVAVIAICCLGLVVVLTSGCKKAEDEPATVEPPATETAEVQPAAQFANVRCPMMGTAMTLASVPENLTRQYKGQKVAFCCGKCPPAWDKLSDEQKTVKLAAAAVKKAD